MEIYIVQICIIIQKNLRNKVKECAKQNNCQKLKLVTTNDNIRALEFYQRRGFLLAKFYKNAIENLRKIKPQIPMLAIITNGPKSQQYSRLENAKISEYFSYIFVSEEIGYNKPNIKFFEYMFEKIEEKDKNKMLVLGDSLTSDIQGGINAGIDTCWCNWKKKENKTTIKPNYEINKLEELLSMLV